MFSVSCQLTYSHQVALAVPMGPCLSSQLCSLVSAKDFRGILGRRLEPLLFIVPAFPVLCPAKSSGLILLKSILCAKVRETLVPFGASSFLGSILENVYRQNTTGLNLTRPRLSRPQACPVLCPVSENKCFRRLPSFLVFYDGRTVSSATASQLKQISSID